MNTRVRYVAEYSYPGAFMPESTTRELEQPTLDAAVAAGPDEDGYFRKDGWYAVKITAFYEKRYVEAGGDAETWVRTDTSSAGAWVVGERVHVDDPSIAGSDFDILRSNIRCNTKSGYGVRTRCGNWQFADDFSGVVAPERVAA